MSVRSQLTRITALLILATLVLSACGTAQQAGKQPTGTQGAAPSGTVTPPQQSAGTAPKPKEYVVGAVLELSGPSSVWGIPQRDSLKLLEKKINDGGGIGGVPLRLVVLDNESDGTKSLVAAKRLVEQENVLAIVGAGSTPTTMPIVPYVTQAKVPLVSVGASNAIIEPVAERKYVFKTPNNDRDQVGAILDLFKRKNIKKIAVLTVNNAYGDSGRSEFETLAPQAGVEVVAWEKFGATDKDVKPQLTNIKAKNPEAVVVWAIPPAASIATKNFKELDIKAQLVHGAGVGSPVFIELAGGPQYTEGVIVASSKLWIAKQLPDGDPQKKLLLEYTKAYEETYKSRVTNIGAMAYDALLLVTEAIAKAGADRERIRDALENLKGVTGLIGTYNLSPTNHNGLAKSDVHFVQVKGGDWAPVQ